MTDESALEAYLASGGQDQVPLVTALDAAIRAAHPGFDVAVKYRMLMYAIDKDWRQWVCAVGTTNHGAALRFLGGVRMADPRGVLRAGTSILKTWDFDSGASVDAEAIGDYVREAVRVYPEVRANRRPAKGSA